VWQTEAVVQGGRLCSGLGPRAGVGDRERSEGTEDRLTEAVVQGGRLCSGLGPEAGVGDRQRLRVWLEEAHFRIDRTKSAIQLEVGLPGFRSSALVGRSGLSISMNNLDFGAQQ
jgi:hypothetical protein